MALKKRKIKKSKIILIVLFIALVLFLVYFFYFKKGDKKVPAPQVEVIDSIDKFNYELNDNETEYYKSLFDSLKNLLLSEDYDEEEYAVLVGKLFLADFYDLNSKVMKSDVGGTQFVYLDYRNDFELGAIDTVYSNVQSNVYGDRKQSLPIVKSIDKVDVSSDSFEYNYDIDYDAYCITFRINYEQELGYPSNVKLILIHNDDKLEIAKMDTL